jgi:preprotein translocase subunit SecY
LITGSAATSSAANWIQYYITDQGTWSHILLYFALIIFFTYFYVGIHVQPGRPRRRAEEVRRLHPGHPSRAPDGGVPAVRAEPDHPARVAVPGHRRHPAEHVPVLHRPQRTTRTSRSAGPPC